MMFFTEGSGVLRGYSAFVSISKMFVLFACDVGRPPTIMPRLVALSVNNNIKVH